MKLKFQYIILILMGMFLLTSCEAEEYLCEALGHEYVEKVVAPTCEEEGYTLHKCAYCEDSYKTNIIKPLGHNTENVDEVLPTCDKEGHTSGVKCTRCDYTTSKVIPALGHDLTVFEAVDPTCLEIGLTKGCKCSRCSYEIKQETIPALEHDLVIDEAVEPTCTNTGLTEGAHCSRCDYHEEQTIIPALGHDYKDVVTTPTCTDKGYTTHNCERCNDSYVDSYVDALGHSYGQWEIILDATEETEGLKKKTCSLCGNVVEQVIPKLEHTHKYEATTLEPTCTKDGYTLYTCKCGDTYKDNYVDALGHNLIIDEKVLPTCTTTGLTEGSHCSRCNYEIAQEVIEKLDHNYSSAVTQPTCESEGYITHTCSRCDDEYVDSYVDALGHDMIIDEKVEPTCTTTGLTEGSHCSRCNYEIAQEVIPALGHEYSDWVIVTNPSCNSEGKDEKACIKCGNIIERDTRITGIENKVLVSNPVDKEYFVGKTLLTIGDSITCGVGLNDKTNEYYGKLVADALGMNVVNKGISGSVYCYGGSATTNNTLNASNIKNADVITIFLGINDFNHACKNGHAYGNPNYTSSDKTYYQVGEYGTTDTSTLYGALKVWCENIKQLKSIEGYEDKQFVIITPLISSWNASIGPRSWDQGKTNIHGHTLREYCTAIMRVYAEYGIPVFDANMLSGIYYNSSSDNNAVVTGGDGVHINAEGHKILANSLVEFLLEGYSYEYRENNSISHQYNNTIVDASCTLDGYTKHICSICYDVYNTDFVNALGHEIIIDEKVEPTCENTGLTKGEHCTKCDYKVAQEVIPALGHDIVIDEKVEPEYNNPGLTEGKHCSRCYLVIEEQVIIEPNIQQMNINYDDHIDISNNVVAIIEKGNPISYKVGFGVSGELDDQVISIKNNYLVATGIGDAVVKIDDIYYEINVKSAPISLILLIGQSNMRGSEGDPNQSIICPNGMVYSTYGDDRGDKEGILNVNSARKFVPSALSGEYSMINVEGTTEHLGYYPVNSLTREGKGKFGPDSGFAYEWVKQTNEKIWVVNAAHGGSSINTWQPNATNYKEAVLMFKACQETLQKEIETGHFTLSHMGYFWCQGCSDSSQSAEWYVNKYLTMHNSLKEDLAFDHDLDSSSNEYEFEFGGIIPILHGLNSYRQGEYKDNTNLSHYISYKTLTFTGPRAAQYWLGNSKEHEDIWLVCNIGDSWMTLPDGTNKVKDYFNKHYPNGKVDYETQIPQKESFYTPTKSADVHDTIHYNQIGYNEIGRESVRNALIMLGEIDTPNIETCVDFYSWDGYTKVSEIEASELVNSSTLIVPIVSPLWKAKEVEYILSDGLQYNYYDIICDSYFRTGKLCTNIDFSSEVTIKSCTLNDYEFRLEDEVFTSVGDTENHVTKISGNLENGYFIDSRYKFNKPLLLVHNENWILEFKMSGTWSDSNSVSSKKILCEDGASSTIGAYCLLVNGQYGYFSIGSYTGSTHESYGVNLNDYNIDISLPHIYRLVNIINEDDSNTIYLYIDGVMIAPMDTYFTGKKGDTNTNSNGLSGKDFAFSYMGTPNYLLDNGIINYISLIGSNASNEIHFHDWTNWEEVLLPSMEGPGENVRECLTCGLKEYEVVNSIWQTTEILDHFTPLPDEFCAKTNLWEILPHDPMYYLVASNKWGHHSSKNVPSITISVEPGDKIFATSFNKAGENGHSTANGIRLTFFGINGIVKTTDPAGTYKEFCENGGYILTPEGAIAVNIALWNNNDDNEIYILNKDHVYAGTTCKYCEEKHSNLENYEGKVISIMSASTSTFAGYIPVADGFNLEHRARYPQDNLFTDVKHTWWMQLITDFNAKLGINESWAGSSILNVSDTNTGDIGPDACMATITRIKNLGSNGTPDVILFYGGRNDITKEYKIGTFDENNVPENVDLETYKWDTVVDAFIAAVLRIKYFYPNTELVIMLPNYNTNRSSDTRLNMLNNELIKICSYYSIKYIDLRNIDGLINHLPDGSHPDEIGMDMITNIVEDVLLQEITINKGENIVYQVKHNLINGEAELHYYKGVSQGKTFKEKVTGKEVTVLMNGVDITDECYQDGYINIETVTGDIEITVIDEFDADGHLQELPQEICSGTNIWNILEHENIYYTIDGWGLSSSKPNVHSVTFNVIPGDKLWATSFQAAGINSHTANGTRITWFSETGLLKSVDRDSVYNEFTKNGYVTVPEGAIAVNIPMGSNSDEYEIYILNTGHVYEEACCTICGYEQPYEIINIQYDDHLEVLNKKIEIVNNDNSIVSLENDYLVGSNIGQVKVYIDDELFLINVTKAKINLVTIMGQSNAGNHFENSTSDITCPIGTAYWWGNGQGINAKEPVDYIQPSMGFHTPLLAELYAQSVADDNPIKNVLIWQEGITSKNGKSITSWVSSTTNTSGTDATATMINNCVKYYTDNSDKFEIVGNGIYWIQGESDVTMNPEVYTSLFMAMWSKLKNAGAEYVAFLRVRKGTTYNEVGSGHKDLDYHGSLTAQLKMINDNSDMFLATSITENWIGESDSVHSVNINEYLTMIDTYGRNTTFTDNYNNDATITDGVLTTTMKTLYGSNNRCHYGKFGAAILGCDAAKNMYNALYKNDFELLMADTSGYAQNQKIFDLQENNEIALSELTNNIAFRANCGSCKGILEIKVYDEEIEITDQVISNELNTYGTIDINQLHNYSNINVEVNYFINSNTIKTATLTIVNDLI